MNPKHPRSVSLAPTLLALSLCLSLSACSGGGGGGGSASAPAEEGPSFSIVAPAGTVAEVEPNESLAAATSVDAGTVLLGALAASDSASAFSVSGVALADLFVLAPSASAQTVSLYGEGQSLLLAVLADDGTLLQQASGFGDLELVVAAGAPVVLGVGGSPGHYRLEVEEGVSPAVVPGELVYQMRAEGGTLAPASLAGHDLVPMSHGGVQGRMLALSSAPMGVAALAPHGPSRPLSAGATRALAAELAKDSRYAFIEPNYLVTPSPLAVAPLAAMSNDPYLFLQWGLEKINLESAWGRTRGEASVVVAVLDTGFRSLTDTAGIARADGYDFVTFVADQLDGDGMDPDPTDPESGLTYSHGTAVASVIAAQADNGAGIAGVAPGITLMPVRVMSNSSGSSADLAQAIRYAAGLANASGQVPSRRADIINMSLGMDASSSAVSLAVAAAQQEGVLVVAASGNSGPGLDSYPAAYPGVIAVGAADYNDQVESYSGTGAWLDVVAPGGNFAKDLNGDTYVDGILIPYNSGGYGFLQGTSLAAPHVSGVLALMRSLSPDLSLAEVEALLAGAHAQTTARMARDMGGFGRDDSGGYGYLDAAGATRGAAELYAATLAPLELRCAPAMVALGRSLETATLVVGSDVAGDELVSVSSSASWLVPVYTPGLLPQAVGLTVARSALAEGAHHASITLTGRRGGSTMTRVIPVSLMVDQRVSAVGLWMTGADLLDAEGNLLQHADSSMMAGMERRVTFEPVPEGGYRVRVGTDADGDGTICEPVDLCHEQEIWVDPRYGTDHGSLSLRP